MRVNCCLASIVIDRVYRETWDYHILISQCVYGVESHLRRLHLRHGSLYRNLLNFHPA